MEKLILFLIAVFFIGMVRGQKVGIGTTIPVAKLEIRGIYTNPTIPDSISTGIVRYSADASDAIDIGKMGSPSFAGWIQAGFRGSADPLTLQPLGGNVGIGTGTTAPNAKLHVNGTLRVADGTQGAGKILTSDATGLASWQAPPPPPPTYYPSVTICCQSWMTKNLDVVTYRNGDAIPKVTNAAAWAALTTGAYCYYNNDSTTYAATYGMLYNLYAVNDPRGLAPEGWHIPSDFEWTTLGTCLGGDAVAGGTMKEIGTTHWNTPNTGATNLSNFTGLPGGFRNTTGTSLGINSVGYWWSCTESGTSSAWYRYLAYDFDDLNRNSLSARYGFSVRCLRD